MTTFGDKLKLFILKTTKRKYYNFYFGNLERIENIVARIEKHTTTSLATEIVKSLASCEPCALDALEKFSEDFEVSASERYGEHSAARVGNYLHGEYSIEGQPDGRSRVKKAEDTLIFVIVCLQAVGDDSAKTFIRSFVEEYERRFNISRLRMAMDYFENHKDMYSDVDALLK